MNIETMTNTEKLLICAEAVGRIPIELSKCMPDWIAEDIERLAP